MSEDIPQWAKDRARELVPIEPRLMITMADVADAFARYIADHEQPPVDPDVIAVREILGAACRNSGLSIGGELKAESAAETAAVIAFRKHKEAGK